MSDRFFTQQRFSGVGNACVILFIFIFQGFNNLLGQIPRRYESELFSSYQLQNNIQYGRAVNASGIAIDLMLDVYTPTGDTVTKRPLVIFIHGGGFKEGDKVSNFGTLVCGGLAKRGYVAASINYRLSTGAQLSDSTKYSEALYRAIQDGKAAVRFFRKFSTTYGIDSSQVFVTGSSAGSKTALHMAYLDQIEVPSFINTSQLGTLEGSSGNAGYSSRISGVINCWGALWDWKYIQAGDVPVYCVHGTEDSTVPYDSSFSYHGFKYGSTIIHERALQLGIRTGLRLFYNTGHTLDNSSAKQDSALKDYTKWLFTILNINNPSGGLNEDEILFPEKPILEQNYPNPFNPETNIRFKLPKAGQVNLSIFNLLGERVATLADGYVEEGIHHRTFNVKNSSCGIYFCQLKSDNWCATKKMLMVE